MMPAAGLGIVMLGLLLAAWVIWWVPPFVIRRRATAAGVTFTAPLSSVAAVSSVALDLSMLTNGELKVHSVSPFDPDHDRNLRWFAGALSHAATDPVGRAVSRLSTRGRLSNVEEVPGVGISGSVDRHPVRIGSPGWLGVTSPVEVVTDVAEVTTVVVEVDAKALGMITLVEALREDAPDGVDALEDLEVSAVVLPGERPALTSQLADQVGLSLGTSEVVADVSGLSAGATFSDPSVPAVAAAVSIARAGLTLRRRCLVAGILIAVLALLSGGWLLLG